jgi:carboxyl-terminal processing protease
MQPFFRRAGLIGLMLFSLLLGVAGGMVLDRQMGANAAPDTGKPDFHLMNEAWDLIQSHFVDRQALKSQELTYGAISGMVNALGDTGHTTFLTPEMVKQERSFTQGSFEGIGAEVEMKDGHVIIAAPIDNSPAQKAGIHPGDIILKVDGQDMTGLALDQVVSKVLGPAGSQVTLTLQDPNTGKTRDLTLTRARITLASVTWRLLPGTTVAHVRITSFSEHVSSDLQTALAAAQKAGASAIVLDLRNNPGGLLDQSVGVASQFLKQGNVLQEKDAQGKIETVKVLANVPKTDLPVVVLTNVGTASAAEIVAGALQDTHRAAIVGEKTFGTGTVLNEFPLSDGSAIMIAVQEWLTPNGRTIWHEGILPDQVVVLPPSVNPLLPGGEQGLTPEQLRASGDVQLLAALDMLTKAGAGNPQMWPAPGVWPGSQSF